MLELLEPIFIWVGGILILLFILGLLLVANFWVWYRVIEYRYGRKVLREFVSEHREELRELIKKKKSN